MKKISYVLITAARNEENYIGLTIESVIKQKIRPIKWIIVSDTSYDKTDEIIKEYERQYNFIKYIRVAGEIKRNFTSKTLALIHGFEYLKDTNYDFIGILDADVSFSPYYYETILKKFLLCNELGVAGGVSYDFENGKFHKVTLRYHSVRGPIQLFRRECFRDIGAWIPTKLGCEDAYAEISARRHGWKVRTFDDAEIFHHRQTGTALNSILQYRFKEGRVDHSLGYHPFFQILKCLGRLKEKPYVVSAMLRFGGFWWASLKGEKRTFPKEFIDYVRKEQSDRIKSLFLRKKSNYL